MLPLKFKPKYEYEVTRLGGDNDGGYLVGKKSIEKSMSLLTLGLGYEWRFEKDYYKLKQSPIICFDHSISYSSVKKISRKYFFSYIFRIFKPKYFTKKNFFKNLFNNIFLYLDYKKFFKNNVHHEKIKVGSCQKEINLETILKHKNLSFPCLLKVDIEGSEYRILDEIIKLQSHFTGIIIEFHDIDLHITTILNFIDKLNFDLIHIHPQNPAPVTTNNIPTQIEFTFSKNEKILGSNPKFPHKLDMPANPNYEEIDLIFNDK